MGHLVAATMMQRASACECCGSVGRSHAGVGVAVVACATSGSLPRAIAFAIVFSECYADVLPLLHGRYHRRYTVVLLSLIPVFFHALLRPLAVSIGIKTPVFERDRVGFPVQKRLVNAPVVAVIDVPLH